MKNQNGFTLIELLLVLIVMGTIALIATPIIDNTVDNVKEKARKLGAIQIYEAARLYLLLTNDVKLEGTVTLEELINSKYLPVVVNDPKTGVRLNEKNTKVNFDAAINEPLVLLDNDNSVSNGYLQTYTAEQLFSP